MQLRKPCPEFWAKKTVAITGNQGFKGSWLCKLLDNLGAITFGFGNDNRTNLLYNELNFNNHYFAEGNINNLINLRDWLVDTQPDVVIHMAAQPLVLESYSDPVNTFKDNIIGSANLLEAARGVNSIKTIIMVTSDKVYRNDNKGISFTEQSALGGKDPYSASKAAAEIIISSMCECFFDPNSAQVHTVRAGNVIGGGDWAKDRLLPDLAKSHISQNNIIIRSPDAIRPWQHVLDPLVGYLLLCEDTYNNKVTKHQAWNFGPDNESKLTVRDVIRIFNDSMEANFSTVHSHPKQCTKEHLFLSIDSSKSRSILNWQTKWTSAIAVKRTAEWYNNYYNNQLANDLVENEINDYLIF
jgi:CDP-glucose 4,6-dehydratase